MKISWKFQPNLQFRQSYGWNPSFLELKAILEKSGSVSFKNLNSILTSSKGSEKSLKKLGPPYVLNPIYLNIKLLWHCQNCQKSIFLIKMSGN